MNGSWTGPDVRDELVDYVRYWSDRTQIKADKMVNWIGITHSKYYDWRCRYGKVNEHNAWIPRDFWLADWEKQEIIGLVQKRLILGNNGWGVMAPTSSWGFRLVVRCVAERPINFVGISRSREVPANVRGSCH